MVLKGVNIFSHVLLMILALCCAGLGGWLITREFWVIKIFGIQYIQLFGYILIGASVLLFLTAIFGLCGTITKSKGCMISFLFIICVVFLILIISGSLLLVYNNQVQDMLSNQLHKEFVQNYGIDPEFSNTWNEIQPELKCCGVKNGVDYKSTRWYNVYNDQYPRDGEVPRSCCTRNSGEEYFNLTMCSISKVEDNGPFIYNEGCWDKMKKKISGILYWTSIGVFILCGIMVLIIIVNCVMNKVISRNALYGQVV